MDKWSCHINLFEILIPAQGMIDVVKTEFVKWKADYVTLARKFMTTRRIISALVLREIMTRFGRENFGFIWLVLEPLILTSLVMIAWSISYGSSKHGVTVVQVVLTGYSMLTLWRHIIGRFIHCFRHNSGLLFHRNVRPMDALIARFFLETVGTFISFFVAYIALFALELIPPVHDFFLLIAAWYLLAIFSFSVALFLSALSELWEPAEKFVQPLMYVKLPLTGAFYMMSWMPPSYRDLLLYSPMISAVEMFRAGVIGPSSQTYYFPGYVMLVSVFLAAGAFVLMRKAQAHIRIE
jgi:capsular polysaccharide transport system permease protein